MNDDLSWLNQTAQMDQLLAAIAQIAQVISTYHAQLLAYGFSDEYAIPLLVAFQSSILRMTSTKHENG